MFSLIRKRTPKSAAANKRAAMARNSVTSRTVTHQRWIPTNQLERGMYVAELNVPWEDTGFMFQGFDIDSNKQIAQIKEVSTHALVCTRKVAKQSTRSSRQVCMA